MPYEIVIHARGVKEEIVSPTTYASTEAAAADFEPIQRAIDEGGSVSLSWYAGKAANVIAATVRETDSPRPARSMEELFADLKEKLPGLVVEDEGDRDAG